MTRRLMQTAWYDLKVAKDNLNEADEIALLISAYHLSQAAGKVVKSVLREMGLSYAKTHRISDLLNDLPEDQDFLQMNSYCGLKPTLQCFTSGRAERDMMKST